jgi:hypothetical protein
MDHFASTSLVVNLLPANSIFGITSSMLSFWLSLSHAAMVKLGFHTLQPFLFSSFHFSPFIQCVLSQSIRKISSPGSRVNGNGRPSSLKYKEVI